MTTSATQPAPVAADLELTDEARTQKLLELAQYADEVMHGVILSRLERFAHPSLSRPRRIDLFELYRENSETAAALRDGVAYRTQFCTASQLRTYRGDPQDGAAELFEEQALEALYALVHGVVER